MIDAHQNLNGSYDLTMPLSGIICHPWAMTAIINLCTKFGVSNLCPQQRYEKPYKMWKMRWYGAVRGHPRSLKIAPFDRAQHEFLLAFHSNYVPILHHFWDMARYWSKFENHQCESTQPLLVAPAPVGISLRSLSSEN